MFLYPIYNLIGGILVLFIYITRLASNKIHREVGRAKDLSALRGVGKSLVRPGRKQATATEDSGFHISNL